MLSIKRLIIFALPVIALSSCQWDYVEPKLINPIDSSKIVSFKNDIYPIFDANCLGCHSQGEVLPDLSEGNAFISLHESELVDTLDPQASELYNRIRVEHWGVNLSNDDVDLILQWIMQGAEYN